jgi:hypothetical protein
VFAQRGCTEDPSYPPSQPAQNDREKERESNFLDGSDHFFTMYTEKAGEYDKKMAERWQADADGILVFVSPYSCPHVVPTGSLITDRSIFCRNGGINCDINPGPPA